MSSAGSSEDFGPAPQDRVDPIDNLTKPGLEMLKVERVMLASAFLGLLVLTLRNAWTYLVKGGMYKSFPILVSYVILGIFCATSFAY